MKKICILLAVMILFGMCPVNAEEEVSVIATYKGGHESRQGVNNWYYVCFSGDDYIEMGNYSTKENQYGVWYGPDNTGARKQVDGFSPGWVYDVGFVFKAPMKGVVRISGTASGSYASTANGDGMIVSVEKDGKEYWKELVTYAEPKECSVEIPVKANDKIYIRMNKNKNDAYDAMKFVPVAEYLAKAYTGGGTEGYKYLQRYDGEITELTYNKDDDRFNATDGIAFMNDDTVLPSDKCSLIKRYEIPEDGRYRINGTMSLEDRRGGGNVFYIYKNDELIWQQLVPEAESEKFDIRIEAKKGDLIDVEAECYKYVGFNSMTWQYKITKFEGVLPFAETSTGSGNTYGVDEKFTLSNKIGSVLKDGTSVYALWQGQKFPMIYDSGSSRWTYKFEDSSTATVSPSTAVLGINKGDVGVDLTLNKTGILKLQGQFSVPEATNGILTKIYLNDKEIWLNREGDGGLGRYDEPFDRNYFNNNIDLTLSVTKGDKLTLEFSRWLKYTSGTSIDFSKVEFKYINGEILSKTTKHKLEQSIVIDTMTNKAYYAGTSKDVSLINKNNSNYIKIADAEAVFGEVDNTNAIVEGSVDYIPIRSVMESENKNVSWVSDRLIIVYDGLPMIFGSAEYSQIDVALKGGDLFD